MSISVFYFERCSEALDSPNFAPTVQNYSIRCNLLSAVETKTFLATDGSSSLLLLCTNLFRAVEGAAPYNLNCELLHIGALAPLDHKAEFKSRHIYAL